MSLQAWLTLAILAFAAVLFLTRWVRLELVALGIPVALYLSGVLPDVGLVLSGFGNHAVIAIAAVFVLSAGLEESGIAAWLARVVEQLGGHGEGRLLLLICVTVAILSAFMSNAATVAVLLPVVLALARRMKRPASRLLMPLGFAAILGGNLTVIGTSSNLLVADFYRQATGTALGMFDFVAVGGAIAAAGILYLLTLGRYLLPANQDQIATKTGATTTVHQLLRQYGVARNMVRMRIGKASTLAGKPLSACKIGRDYQIAVLLIARPGAMGEKWFRPKPEDVLQVGDELYLDGPELEAWRLAEESQSRLGLAGEHSVERVLDHGFGLAELALPQHSSLLGKTIKDLDFRRRFGVTVLSLWRSGAAYEGDLASVPLMPGDSLLVAASTAQLKNLPSPKDLLLLAAPAESWDFGKAPVALFCLAVALLPPMLSSIPLAISALLGAILMVLLGAVSADRATKYLEWKVLAMIVGTIPLGLALKRHGVTQWVAAHMLDLQPMLGFAGVLSLLYLLAATVSITSSNAAAAVILSPVALQIAETLQVHPRVPLLAVAFGCSCAFLVPFAHQCNLMVAGPGGYRARDFLGVGAGLSLVVSVVAIGLLSWMA